MNYDSILSDHIQGVKPSGIRKFFDILEEMKDAISLGIGEPDFVTPWHIRDAGIYSLEKGFTKYDVHDTRLHKIYKRLTDEIVGRLKEKGELNG